MHLGYRMEQSDSWEINNVVHPEPGVACQQPPQQQRGNPEPGADLRRTLGSAGHHLLPHVRQVHQHCQDTPQQGGAGGLLPGESHCVACIYTLHFLVYLFSSTLKDSAMAKQEHKKCSKYTPAKRKTE